MQKHSSKALWLLTAVVVLSGIAITFYQQGPRVLAAQEPATTSSAAGFEEGVHFLAVDPPIDSALFNQQAAAKPDAITVTEFFWYGCPHCQYFEPLVEEWQTTFTDDLVFEQVPVVWNDLTQLHASIYYLGLESNDPLSLHHTLFKEVIALRTERDPSAQLAQLGNVLVANGVESESINENLNSPPIRDRVERANKLMRAAQVSSTPTLLVDYKWVILNDKETGEAGIFNVANHLIELAKQARQ